LLIAVQAGVLSGHEAEKGEKMQDQNRVLSRTNARELTQSEIDVVNGGFITFSLCTSSPSPDGDQHPFEAGC
jgi:hypothetical protein